LPGQGEIAVKPRVQQGTAIDFNAQLQEAFATEYRIGLYFQARAVSVSANHAHAGFGCVRIASVEGHNRRTVANGVITGAGLLATSHLFHPADENPRCPAAFS